MAALLVVVCATSVLSEDGQQGAVYDDTEDAELPVDAYEDLDPISFAQEETGADDSAEESSLAAAEEAAHRMDEGESEQQQQAPAESKQKHQASETFQGGNPHEQQMDDLFGDMREQQEDEQRKNQARSDNTERFETMKAHGSVADDRLNTAEGGAGSEDLGESNDDLGESATVSAEQSSALASPDGSVKPGTDELQSYSTGHVTQEVQVGSKNGLLAGTTHGFTQASKIPSGRVILFGNKNGLYLHKKESTWSIYSDTDKESGGVCLMTAYNKEATGLKVCHTGDKSGKWASGNVGISGDLMVEGKDTKLNVQRLHLTQTKVGPAGFVLQVGGGEGGAALQAGSAEKFAWMQGSEKKPLLLNPISGFVGVGTTSPKDKLHVAGDMAVRNLHVGHNTPVLTPNKLLFKSGTGWEMIDKQFMRVINSRGIEAQAGAYFSGQVGINFNWKSQKTDAKLRINDGKLAVTRNIGKQLTGVAYFYDDALAEGRVYAKDFTKNKWSPMRWEAEAIIFNPDGKSPIAIGTRTPKAKYLLHIHGNNKIDGHIYVAQKMKVGGKAHVGNMHTPRLNVKDQRGRDGSGQKPADGVKEFVIGEWVAKGLSYELKAGGTNLRLGYYKKYCWMQMWPKGRGGSPLVLNGAGNRVGFGTSRPLTNIPGSGSQLLFHVDGNMLVDGNLVVKGEVSGQTLETESLIDVGFDDTASALHQLNARKNPDDAPHFGDSSAHKGAISVSHVAATLTRSLQQHQNMMEKHELLLSQHTQRLEKIERQWTMLNK